MNSLMECCYPAIIYLINKRKNTAYCDYKQEVLINYEDTDIRVILVAQK